MHCYRSISVAPVRGGTYFSLPPQRKDRQKKAARTPCSAGPPRSHGSGASGIRALAPSALVTKGSSAPTPHCVRRGWVCMGNQGLRLGVVGASASPRRGAQTSRRRVPQAVGVPVKSARAKPQQPVLRSTVRRAQRRRKYDCLVTRAECARAQIPDAPLPWLCGGPA